MRFFALLLACTALAAPAFASSEQDSFLNSLANAPVAEEAGNITATTTPPPTELPAIQQPALPQPAKQEIGFDPKVKRDPNGKPIAEDKKPATTTPVFYGLRTDRDLPSDKDLIKSNAK